MYSVASAKPTVRIASASAHLNTTLRSNGSLTPLRNVHGLKYSRATLFTPSTVRVQRRREVASSAARSSVIFAAMAEDPDTSRGAINTGSQLFKEGKYEEALAEFERALKLPGTGQKRFTDKPPESSDEEKHTALYNISCCYCQLEDERLALVSFAGALEKGFKQWNVLLSDPMMEFLRTNEKLPGLLQMYNKEVSVQVYKMQNPDVQLSEERTGLASFMKGDWLFKALTKRKPLTESEWMDMVGDGKGTGMMAKFQNRPSGSEDKKNKK